MPARRARPATSCCVSSAIVSSASASTAARPAPEADAESSSVATTRGTPNVARERREHARTGERETGRHREHRRVERRRSRHAQLADERHLRGRREHARAVDRGDARVQQRAYRFERRIGRCTQERDIAAPQRRQFRLHGEDAAAEFHLGAERALAGDRNQLAHGERGLVEHREQLRAQRTRRADDRDAH